jgi:hypothetical protein
MFGITSSTLLRASFALAVFCSWQPGASIGQTVPVSPAATAAKTDGAVEPVCPAVSGTTPPTVNPGQSARLTICTNGTVDLGNLTIGQFGIRPSAFASNYKILNQYATAMLFDVDIASSAKPGRWTVFVNDARPLRWTSSSLPPCRRRRRRFAPRRPAQIQRNNAAL